MAGTANGSAPPHARSSPTNGVTPQERDIVGLQYFLEAGNETVVVSTEHVGDQDTNRLGTLGGQIRKVHCDQLPCDVGRVLPFEDMDALDQRIVGQDKCFVADFENGSIVFEAPRSGVGGQRSKRCDEFALVQRPISLATASRIPFTNFASRSSKNAFATSTYSLIAAALGTSLRAISS